MQIWYSGVFFCFRQQHFRRTAVFWKWVRTSGVWQVVAFRVLHLAKDQEERIAAFSRELGKLHASFAVIEEEHFLMGTRVHAALEKMSSSNLKMEFQVNARVFLDEFCSTILSTVAVRSKLGQGVSCFCPEIQALFLYGQLLDGLN